VSTVTSNSPRTKHAQQWQLSLHIGTKRRGHVPHPLPTPVCPSAGTTPDFLFGTTRLAHLATTRPRNLSTGHRNCSSPRPSLSPSGSLRVLGPKGTQLQTLHPRSLPPSCCCRGPQSHCYCNYTTLARSTSYACLLCLSLDAVTLAAWLPPHAPN
jgi:hypothetical protein